MLTNFNKARIITKDAVNPKSRGNQKNRCRTVKMAVTNLKRGGFVFITDDLILKNIEHKPRRAQSDQRKHKQYLIKRSAAVFLMRVRLRKRLIAGSDSHRMTKRFGYFGAPKCVAFLNTAKNNINCEKLPCPAA